MSSESIDSASIGPKTSLSEITFPQAVSERFGTLYGTEGPETAAEWVAEMREAVEREHGREPTVEDLCTADDGDHTFVGEDTEQSYICVLDPLVYPFLTGESGTVRSTTPVEGTTVTFEVTADGIDVSHDDAVVSIGVSDHVAHVEEVSLDVVYRQVCGYVQTFEDETEYEQWAADADAATTALSAAEGLAVTRGLAETLFGADK